MRRREAVKALAVVPVAAAGLVGRWEAGVAAPAGGGVLMLYSTREGQTRRIVEFMADLARTSGHIVEVGDLALAAGPVVSRPAAVLVAASIHMGRHDAEVARWVRANGELLDRAPSAFLSVSLSAAQVTKRAEAQSYVDSLLTETGWAPDVSGLAAGALAYTRYGFVKRRLMRKIAEDGGLPTDTSRDHEFTDWGDVTAFTETFLASVPATPVFRSWDDVWGLATRTS